MPSFVTLTDVKLFLGITGTSEDVLLNSLIPAVSATINTICGRALELGTYAETFDVPDSIQDSLMPLNYPILSVVAITDNGTALTVGTEVVIERTKMLVLLLGAGGAIRARGDILVQSGPFFTSGRQTIQMTYSAGHEPIPKDLKLLTNKVIGGVFNSKDQGNFKSERIGDYSYTVLSNMLVGDPILEQVLKNYKRVSF